MIPSSHFNVVSLLILNQVSNGVTEYFVNVCFCHKQVQPKHVKEAFRLLNKSIIRVEQPDIHLEEEEEEIENAEVAMETEGKMCVTCHGLPCDSFLTLNLAVWCTH